MGHRHEVLVVDNDAGVRAVLAATLRHYGLAVRLASGVAEAVAAYADHRRAIGAVLLDVLLGDGDGPDALALMRNIDPSVRCCFLTGGDSDYSDGYLLELGAVHVFQKPVLSFAGLAQFMKGVIAS